VCGAHVDAGLTPYVVEELEDLGEGVVLAVDGAGDHEAVPRLAPVEQRGVFLCMDRHGAERPLHLSANAQTANKEGLHLERTSIESGTLGRRSCLLFRFAHLLVHRIGASRFRLAPPSLHLVGINIFFFSRIFSVQIFLRLKETLRK
jgi:hypothetical protein